MGDIKDIAADVYRDFEVDGVPASGVNDPAKPEIRRLFSTVDERIGAAIAGIVYYATGAARAADTSKPVGTLGKAADEPDYYRRTSTGWVVDNTVYEGVSTAIQPDIDKAGRDTLFKAFSTPLQIGESPGSYTAFVGPTAVFSLGFHFLQRAVLVGGKVNTQVAGTIEILRAARTGDSGKHQRMGDPFVINVPGGVYTFGSDDIYGAGQLPFIFNPGEIAAFRAPAAVRYTGSNLPYYSWPNGLSDTPTLTSLNIEGNGALFDIELYFRLEAPVLPAAHAILEQIDTFTAVPGGWVNDASAAPTGGALLLTTPGFLKQLSTGKPYGLDRRSVSFDVQFGTVDAHLQFQTNPAGPVDSGQYEGSLCVIEATNKRLSVYQRWDGSGSVPPIATADQIPLKNPDGTTITIAANRTYTVEVEKIYRDYRVTLTDPAGPTFFSYLVSNNDTNTFTDAYGTHTKYGMMHGAPGIASVQGAVRLYNWKHTAKYRQFCAWYFNGDSLTEGYGVGEAQRMGALFADQFGEDNVAISGVGGRDTRGGILSMFCELDALSPQNVLIYLGSNGGDGGDYAGNLARMVRLARNRGANVVLATVTGSADRAAAAAAIPGVTLTRFGSATTTAGPGSTPIDYYYVGIKPGSPTFKDGLHGNAEYHKRNYAQFLRDAGRLIDAGRA